MLSFDSLIVTTRTVVADTNVVIDKEKLYEILPITEFALPERKRGRRGAEDKTGVSSRNITSGSIIFAGYGAQTKGVSPKGSTRTFKNSISIVMVIKQRLVNFKLTQNGRFHITGNNDDYYIEKCIKHMWKLIQQYPAIYTLNGTCMRVTVWPSMVNMKTNVGFRLDRQRLNDYVNNHTQYISMFETSSGSASVNIKMPLEVERLVLNTLVCRSGKWVRGTTETAIEPRPVSRKKLSGCKMTTMSGRFVTFLVFHTGEMIMSSLDRQVMQPYFDKFCHILDACRENIIV